jgi:hypothetical protein
MKGARGAERPSREDRTGKGIWNTQGEQGKRKKEMDQIDPFGVGRREERRSFGFP